MKTTIVWTLMFRVSARDRAEKALERAGVTLGHALRLDKCERYWKIPELWVCNASSEFEAAAESDQVFQCLLLAGRLGWEWSVSGPHLRPDGTLQDFRGVFDCRSGRAKAQSLEWAEFGLIPDGSRERALFTSAEAGPG